MRISSVQLVLIQLLLGASVCQLVAHVEGQTAVVGSILADGWCTKQSLGFTLLIFTPSAFVSHPLATLTSLILREDQNRPLIPEVQPT